MPGVRPNRFPGVDRMKEDLSPFQKCSCTFALAYDSTRLFYDPEFSLKFLKVFSCFLNFFFEFFFIFFGNFGKMLKRVVIFDYYTLNLPD